MNTVAACACNARKADRTPEQARMPLLFMPYVPSRFEDFLLKGRRIRADVHEWLAASSCVRWSTATPCSATPRCWCGRCWRRTWVSVPALQRADLGGDALRRCGFMPEALHQTPLRLYLAA